MKFGILCTFPGVDADRVALPVLVNTLQCQAVEHAAGAGFLDDCAPKHGENPDRDMEYNFPLRRLEDVNIDLGS